MQHIFGVPSVFLTVTFDDENSLIMQVLSDVRIDDDRDIFELSDSEIAERASLRKELRLKYPGLGALNFEILFQIVMKKVVGWDMRRNVATTEPGLFGSCEAVTVSIEEQGRLTIHGHICIWVKKFKELRKKLFFGSKEERREVSQVLPKYNEHIATTE